MGSTGQQMGPRSALSQFAPVSTANSRRTGGGHTHAGLFATVQVAHARCFYLRAGRTGFTLLNPYLIKVSIDQYISQKTCQGLDGFRSPSHCHLWGFICREQVKVISSPGEPESAHRFTQPAIRHILKLSLAYHDTNMSV